MRIILYIVILCIGAYLGYGDRLSKKVLDKLSHIQCICLLGLLFIMGINIGINEEVVHTFYKLGYQSLVLSIFSIIFSILGVKMISKFLYVQEETQDDH